MAGTTRIIPPSVDRIVRALDSLDVPDRVKADAARQSVEVVKRVGAPSEFDEIVSMASEFVAKDRAPSPKPVINMSGVILHTGLGRARFSQPVMERAIASLASHSAVEFDVESGHRGDRQDLVRDLLCSLTGAEDSFVVNNCAAAVVLTLTALCQGKEVVLSRGQMVEIGGSFRMPDIVESSGCRLVEVGCTNKTRVSDYEAVLRESSGAILRCHPSNFRLIGFTAEPTARELSQLARKWDTILIDDLGHGCLVDTTRFGLPKERTISEAVKDGANLVLASGDKLMGGPQCGIILGDRDLVSTIARHPLARAMRVDKLTLAFLEATLKMYRDGRELEIATWRYASRPIPDVKRDALAVSKAYQGTATVEPSETQMGGGSMPETGIASFCARLSTSDADALLKRLRLLPFPVIGRIEKGAVMLDPRTCEPDELKVVCAQLKTVVNP